MRKAFELQTRGGGRRITIVREQILPAQFYRIDADLRRRQFDQAFGHRGRDRMTDRAVLAHHVLVLEYDAGAGAIIRAGIGTADKIDDLIGLDA